MAFSITGLISAQSSGPASSPWSLSIAPMAYIPLVSSDGSANTLFSNSWGGDLAAKYALPMAFPLAAELKAAYSVGGIKAVDEVDVDGSFSEIQLLAGLDAGLRLGRVISLFGFLDGGAAYGTLSSGVDAPYGVVKAGLGLAAGIGKRLTARLDTAMVYKFGLSAGIGGTLGLSYRLPARSSPASLPDRPRLLSLVSMDVQNVFPIFRSYYDEHSLGTARILNTGKEAATNVRVGFFVRQYMDAPKSSAPIGRIEPGRSVDVPLFALFNDRILDVTEATKVSGEVSVQYGDEGKESLSGTVLVYDRNALTWSDDRHAAAFVSSKDPWVLDLVGNILAAVKDARNPELSKNLQTAIALHEGLRVYGLSYILSPNRPFAQEGGNLETVDTLKFPRQTLGFRSGDCADLSVLYASCFEAAGIETAFITIPGHIFMALDLGLSFEETQRRHIAKDALVVRGEKVWLPIETTLRGSDFSEAWQKAAEEWREASSRELAAVYPLHEAWAVYAPVGLPADGSSIVPPSSAEVLKAFRLGLAKAVSSELGGRLAALGAQTADAKTMNDRGVLYAKYGSYDEAAKSFAAAAAKGNAPALVNLGNLAMLKSDPASALAYFQNAAAKMQGNAKLLLSLAKAAQACGKGEVAAQAFDAARSLDPAAAEKYSRVAEAAVSATRAAEVEVGQMDWF